MVRNGIALNTKSTGPAGQHIVVTGCAGFIGFHLARRLAETGHLVRGIDSLASSYYVRSLKQWRLDELRKWPSFTLNCSDVRDREALKAAFRASTSRRPIDAVFHLAALANVRDSVVNPRLYYETNVLGTLNLLENSREFGVGRFILASTSSVYGAQDSGPVREDAISNRPLSPYGASKVAAEATLYSYHHLYGMASTVLRYFTVYGPAGRPDMSALSFIQAIHEGRPITVHGDGTQRRDFVYVDDVVRGTLASIALAGYETINLGHDRPVALNDVITMIEEALGRTAEVQYGATNAADPLTTHADIGRAKALLGWSPTIGIEEGIRRTVAWYLKSHKWKSSPACRQ